MESSGAVVTLNYFELITGLIGGLALFLFGMDQLTNSMKMAAGSGMKNLLARMTSNRIKAAVSGAVVTAVVNSSSVTTVLVVGFVSAGLISLPQSIGVILGANVGSTITAQIVAFNVTHYSLLMIATGFFLPVFVRWEKARHYGLMILGLGLLFLGMSQMSGAARPLRSYPPFINLMAQMETPLLGIAVGALFTAVIQSSGATTGIIIVLASQGFVTLEAGIALAFGANIGTCVTALLASIGKPREAVQAAVVHISFNVIGVIIWLAWIDQLADFVRWISPSAPQLEGMARLRAECPRQIANAHTAFNIFNTLLFLGFTKPLARFVEHVIPPRRKKETSRSQPKYLNETLLESPDIALYYVRLEMERLGRLVLPMMERIPTATLHGSQRELETIADMDDDIDDLHNTIITFLGKSHGSHSRINSRMKFIITP